VETDVFPLREAARGIMAEAPLLSPRFPAPLPVRTQTPPLLHIARPQLERSSGMSALRWRDRLAQTPENAEERFPDGF
jgi:hypothetical protein